MTSLSPFLLCAKTITAPLSDVQVTEGTDENGDAQSFWDGLDALNALTVVADFKVSGATSQTAVLSIDTRLSSGGIWIPVLRFDFGAAQLTKWMTIVRAAQASAQTIATLSADTAIHLLGNAFRARLTTTGTYPNGTLLDVRAQPAI
jgi:hypothetical protein